MNRLAHEKSPYLLQHRDNPVDWFPWGPEAFEKARREDKPVFLSVGYATCHWCHVMAHESFESEEVARIVNASFVAIKVDREERPDVDSVYMAAVQAMTGQGGWPMTVFMTPDGEPFFAGTYFPPDDRYGRPGFPRLLLAIDDAWRTKRSDVVTQGRRLLDTVRDMQRTRAAPDSTLPEGASDRAVATLRRGYDDRHGGFGHAPKFPRPMTFSLLLRRAARDGDEDALAMVHHTLLCMARGGIYDQLAGGFARYSTDERWLVPHFEKMLYDNALLARSYLECFQVTGDDELALVARETLDYVLRDMTAPEGGFTSAEDADSEGEEGKFYVWTPAELESVLGRDDAEIAAQWYGVVDGGNFEHSGASVLTRQSTRAVDADRIADIRQRLLAARNRRVRPLLDDKVLTAWNGLAIGAMALGHRVQGEPRYLAAATRAADFVLGTLRKDGRLLRRWRDGEARFDAYLDDYTCLAEGLLELYVSTRDARWATEAAALMREAVARFWDDEAGGFFFSAEGHDPLVSTRIKEAYDGAVPSGNSVAVHVLLRLAALEMDEGWRQKAERTLRAYARELGGHGEAHPYLLAGLDDFLRTPKEVVLASPDDAMLAEVWRRYLPGVAIAYVDPGAPTVPLAAGKTALHGRPTAYVCERFTCRAPVTTPAALAEALTSLGPSGSLAP